MISCNILNKDSQGSKLITQALELDLVIAIIDDEPVEITGTVARYQRYKYQDEYQASINNCVCLVLLNLGSVKQVNRII